MHTLQILKQITTFKLKIANLTKLCRGWLTFLQEHYLIKHVFKNKVKPFISSM